MMDDSPTVDSSQGKRVIVTGIIATLIVVQIEFHLKKIIFTS